MSTIFPSLFIFLHHLFLYILQPPYFSFSPFFSTFLPSSLLSFIPSVLPPFLIARLSTPRHYRHQLLSRDTQELRFTLISSSLRHQLIKDNIQPLIMCVTQRCCVWLCLARGWSLYCKVQDTQTTQQAPYSLAQYTDFTKGVSVLYKCHKISRYAPEC